jgi:hypothetical protein
MTALHGKEEIITVDAKDLTEFKKTSNWEVNPDIHDITGGGRDSKRYRGGQVGRSFTMGGWYDSDLTTGPGYLETIAGETVEMVRKPQGTGTGLPTYTFDVVVGKYVESGKNDDIVQWTCDFTVDGDVVKTTQA